MVRPTYLLAYLVSLHIYLLTYLGTVPDYLFTGLLYYLHTSHPIHT